MRISDNSNGLILTMLSSLFIGTSFILKKKGLKRVADSGTSVGYTYLLQLLWWTGMITMMVGETANFVAYVYAPAVLVTLLGALSIIASAVLAHFILKERLPLMGAVGCVACIVGSVIIVLHAPEEHTPNFVHNIWDLAKEPAFLIYAAATLATVLALVLHFEPCYGQTNILVYLGICSLMGSFTKNSTNGTAAAGAAASAVDVEAGDEGSVGGRGDETVEISRENSGPARSRSVDEFDGDGEPGEDGDDDKNKSKKRKKYHRRTIEQIREMEALFKESPHPDEKQRQQLSKQLGLHPRQVKFWFLNRRTQIKAIQDRRENS